MTNRTIRNIYWFAYYNLDSPSVRYRAKYPLDFAKEKLGINCKLVIPGFKPKRLFNFIYAFLKVLIFSNNDTLFVIQRVRSNFIYANLLKVLVKFRKENSVYDLDDADYLEYDHKNIFYFVKNCNFISAGSQEIKDYLLKLNKNTFHITSPILDLGIYKRQKNEIFTVGWVGGYNWGHKESLFKYFFPAIKSIPFDCKLILIGVTKTQDEKEIREYFESNKNLQLEIPLNINWQNEKDLQERIVKFDVGVATLLNNQVQLSKSGIKAKQYMNNGVPVLCNNLPENNKIIIQGHNGFICDSIDDFLTRIIQFKEMANEEYLVFSKNARSSIIYFDHNKYFEDFEKLKNGTQQRI